MSNIRSLLNVLRENPELTEEATGQSNSADRALLLDNADLEDGDEQVLFRCCPVSWASS